MKQVLIIVLIAPLLSLSAPAAVTINWTNVGDPGNAADSTGFGSVAYPYQISKYEVTNSQYTQFLNAKDPSGVNALALYQGLMSTESFAGGIDFNSGNAAGSKYTVKAGQGNKPVEQVSWTSSIRFANWLNNGQGNGDTESGAYNLSSGSIKRTAGATIVLPNQNEWYKAAYYKGGSTNAGYWLYATRSNTPPVSDQPADALNHNPTNSANYYNDDGISGNGVNDGYAVSGSTVFPTQNAFTDVGAYTQSASAYGTFDQNGNAYEWLEELSAGNVLVRGGSWNNLFNEMSSTFGPPSATPSDYYYNAGFRVASVPEPGNLTLLGLGVFALVRRRRAAHLFGL